MTDYLEKNQDVERFVILDDAYARDFNEVYPKQFVHCRRIFDDAAYRRALSILQD